MKYFVFFLGHRKQISEHYFDKTTKYSFQKVPTHYSPVGVTSQTITCFADICLVSEHISQQLPSSQQ
jgi:hypothetical protein